MHAAEIGTLDYLRDLVARLEAAGHGEKGVLIDGAATFLSTTRQGVYRQLLNAGYCSGKKIRADKGDSRLSDKDARTIATLMVESYRQNGKRLLGVDDAMQIARANNMISTTVSPSTALRIMRQRGLHPDQITKPSPHTEMRSLHPNHVWQFDVSVCVLFYLDKGGLGVMDEKRFYKNKPENVAKISKQRVLRYLITDHYTGALYVHYYMGSGETQEILFSFLMDAFHQRSHEQDPLHGVPFIMVWDAGSANQSALIKNLLDRLDCKHIAHTPGNPRGKGQVENGHNIVECKFEGRLFMMNIQSVEQLNEQAHIWMRHFNGTFNHSRHGHTRYGLWQSVRADQLRICPPRELCELLLRTRPESRQVRGSLVVQFTVKGFDPAQYSVAHVPDIRVGEYVDVCVNPYKAPSIYVVMHDADGTERHYECEPLGRDVAGFLLDAPVYGESYKTTPDTDADQNRKQMAKDAYGAETQLEVDKARNEKRPAFNGEVDPISYMKDETSTVYMQRKGTEMDVPDHAAVEVKPMTITEACKRLVVELGHPPEGINYYALVQKLYPDGVPNEAFNTLVMQITSPQPTTIGSKSIGLSVVK